METAIVPYSKKIPLSQRNKGNEGKFVLVGYWWYDWLMQWKWQIIKSKKTFYAKRTIEFGLKKASIRLHRILLKTQLLVDHKDRDGLNCLPHNLREATYSENRMNSENTGTSQFKGVSIKHVKYKNKIYQYWSAEICKNGKRIKIGQFKKQEDAAKAYDKKALELFGEFANLNFK